MKETIRDTKIYARALDKAAVKHTPPTNDETFGLYVRRIGLDAIIAFEDQVDLVRSNEKNDLYRALDKCKVQFSMYAEQHRAKNTEESLAKAVVNEGMVAMIQDAMKGI